MRKPLNNITAKHLHDWIDDALETWVQKDDSREATINKSYHRPSGFTILMKYDINLKVFTSPDELQEFLENEENKEKSNNNNPQALR